jgi:hypothetical protein
MSLVVQNFQAGAGSQDRIDLSQWSSLAALSDASAFDWVLDHSRDIDGNAVLDFGDETLTLLNVSTASLHLDDFLV